MRVIWTADLRSSDPTLTTPIEVHLHDDGRALAVYDGYAGEPDAEYATLRDLERAHLIRVPIWRRVRNHSDIPNT